MINAYMSTISERSHIRRQAVDSLLPQVDTLTIRLGEDELGDANKFIRCEEFEGYVLICDDDLIFREDYVSFMIEQIEKYNREAVISLHGRTFREQPIRHYNRCDRIFCLRGNKTEQSVHIVGTGVLAFHSSTMKLSISDFKSKNMADIWFSIACEKQGVKRIVPKFDKGMVTHLHPKNTIASQKDKSKETEACNSIEWRML